MILSTAKVLEQGESFAVSLSQSDNGERDYLEFTDGVRTIRLNSMETTLVLQYLHDWGMVASVDELSRLYTPKELRMIFSSVSIWEKLIGKTARFFGKKREREVKR